MAAMRLHQRPAGLASPSLIFVRAYAIPASATLSNLQNSISTIRRRTSTSSSRSLHSGRKTSLSVSFPSPTSPNSPSLLPKTSPPQDQSSSASAPLSNLPLSLLIRNIAITTATSSPFLLTPSLYLLSKIAYATPNSSAFLSPRRNPLLRFLLKRTLFAQFCAGENAAEVRHTLQGMRRWGIDGVMLTWAREVEKRGEDEHTSSQQQEIEESDVDRLEISEWVDGTLQTLQMVSPRDCVCVKLSGAGALNLAIMGSTSASSLSSPIPSPSPSLAAGLTKIASAAREKDVTLCIDAEQAGIQRAIDAWTADLQRRFNSPTRAYIAGTYQAYLQDAPVRLAHDLEEATRLGFCLGVKLVRGAYLASDPRPLMHGSKEDTDACYDRLARALIERDWDLLTSPTSSPMTEKKALKFPEICLVLATHNLRSTRLAMSLRAEQAARSERQVDMIYAQLMGMADHVSCEVVARKRQAEAAAEKERPRPYKYLVWGSIDECLKYLVRRAEENRDAVERTVEARKAFWAELRRRALGGRKLSH